MSGDKVSSEDVELVARKMRFAATGADHWDLLVEHARDSWRVNARAVLAALAGRLLPAGGEERTEWRVTYAFEEAHRVVSRERSYSNRTEAQMRTELAAARELGNAVDRVLRRTVTEWPDGSVLTGPWLPVEEGTQT